MSFKKQRVEQERTPTRTCQACDYAGNFGQVIPWFNRLLCVTCWRELEAFLDAERQEMAAQWIDRKRKDAEAA